MVLSSSARDLRYRDASMTPSDDHARAATSMPTDLARGLSAMTGRTTLALVAATALLVVACAQPSPSTTSDPSALASAGPTVIPATEAPSTSGTAGAATDSPAPAASTDGFAFAADDVLAYYETQGFACAAAQPSTTAAGYQLRTCLRVDDAGRTITIGLVTDPGGAIGDAYASVQGKEGEAFMAPTDALDPLAGFLGAMLGEERGSALLEWLAGHLGDVYAEMETGPLKVATYTESETDVSKLFVELANDAYLSAPAP